VIPSLTIVTAADETYWRCLWQFFLSARRRGVAKEARLVAYDLGLEGSTLARFKRAFPWAEFRRFDFTHYPRHVAVATRSYAWKPLIVALAATEFGGDILWLDSANLFRTGDLSDVRTALAQGGTYVLKGASALELRCDAAVLDDLGVPEEDRKRPERPSGIVGFDTKRATVRNLIAEWASLALQPERILSRTKGHNPDQALLSILLFKYERQGEIGLSEDEIDISSPAPVRWVSTRNKVSNGVPVWADPLVRLHYFFDKTLDQAWLRFQRRRRMGHKAG
jgi:hypothetical protein